MKNTLVEIHLDNLSYFRQGNFYFSANLLMKDMATPKQPPPTSMVLCMMYLYYCHP